MRKRWNEDFILAIGILVFALGLIFYEITVWNCGVTMDWHMAVAMLIGFLAYVHSFLLVAMGIMFILEFKEKHEDERPNPFIAFGLLTIDIAAIIQAFFWGIAKSNKDFIFIGLSFVGLFCLILAVLCGWMLCFCIKKR